MSQILYFFVDESGNADKGTGFSTVGCWCVSNRTNEYEVLDSTKGFLLQQARNLKSDDSFSEIKSSKLHPNEIDDLMQAMLSQVHQDKTIETPRVWESSQPIRYTTYRTLPDITRGALNGMTSGSLSNGQIMRLMSLISAVSPLFQPGIMNLDSISEIKIILDDTVWDGPANIVKECFDFQGEIGVPTAFKTHDSRAVPGLQIADLAAYSWHRNLRKGDCTTASKVVRDNRL
ncbi:DUF3800 domain-containing protein [Haloferax larsenii]|uniref:DUF3800 domain-containing protein n=1 Tax=Haloferax larsenii TaxID=302484 RepID=A0A1H7KZR1_HALLR|nr:DUF3800 domain-containing protein [Haloferax larsenii]SEK92271.1 hypothetical protein SAMN04488691_102167 [Haloferax larsenii]